jgi:hypothetical protein
VAAPLITREEDDMEIVTHPAVDDDGRIWEKSRLGTRALPTKAHRVAFNVLAESARRHGASRVLCSWADAQGMWKVMSPQIAVTIEWRVGELTESEVMNKMNLLSLVAGPMSTRVSIGRGRRDELMMSLGLAPAGPLKRGRRG